MGGKGSGGRRVGSGAKPKEKALRTLHGSRRSAASDFEKSNQAQNQTGNQNEAVAPPPPPLPIPEPPGSLTLDELPVWNELAPIAQREGTLTLSTRLALRDLCQNIVLRGKLKQALDDDGLTVHTPTGALAAHPLLTRLTAVMQRVEAGMMRFRLSPMGREIAPPVDKTPNMFDQFDEDPFGQTAH